MQCQKAHPAIFGHDKVTRVEPIMVWRNGFFCLACVHFCKAPALLQIAHFTFQKNPFARNSSTCQGQNFLLGEVEECSYTNVLQTMRQDQAKTLCLGRHIGSTLVTLKLAVLYASVYTDAKRPLSIVSFRVTCILNPPFMCPSNEMANNF